MPTYMLHWRSGETTMAEGNDLADACEKAGIQRYDLSVLDTYDDGEKRVRVAGQATCGCVYHAQEGLSCEHDIGLVWPR